MAVAQMIRPTPQGIVLEVRVIPRAARSGLDGVRSGALLVRLQSPPVGGAANKELTEVIADALGVSKGAVTIAAGERSRHKRVHVSGVSVHEAEVKLIVRGAQR